MPVLCPDPYTTKLHGLYDPAMARAAATNDLAIAEAARVESVKKVAALEKEIAETRQRSIARGGTEAQADAGVQNKRAELKLAKRAQADAEKAEAEARNAVAALDTKPLRMGVHPLDPIQGKPGAITPGAKSWLEAYPLELGTRTIPLPPLRPGNLPTDGAPRGIGSVNDVLGTNGTRGDGGWSERFGGKPIPVEVLRLPEQQRAEKAAPELDAIDRRAVPDQRLEATVKPDQIRASVDQPVPVSVSGQVTETVSHQHHHTVQLNTEMLRSEIRSVATQTVKSIPLSVSGARPGAISMPGAAGTPGAQ